MPILSGPMKRLTAILLFLCLPCAEAAITLVQKVTPNTGGGCSTTISANTSGNLLAVFCNSDTGSYCTNVTDNASGGSNTYTEVTGSRGAFSGSIGTGNIFYSQTAHGGATVVTCGTGCTGCLGNSVYEYSGALASGSPVDTSSGSVAQVCSGTNCTGAAVTTTNSGDVIFTGVVPGNSVTAVAAPYTDFLNNATNGNASADYIPGTTVSNNSAVWTSASGDTFGTSVAAFLPAAGGGGGVTPNFTIYNNGLTVSQNLTTSGNSGLLTTKRP